MSVLETFDLTGRVAIVTGSSRGIGAAMARTLDEAGARVALVARDTAALDRVAGELRHDPIVLRADLARPDAPEMVVDRVHIQAGSVDILVNNSGICRLGPSVSVSLDDWDTTQAVNLRAPFLLAREAAKVMATNGGGKIVNVSSVSAVASDWSAAYTASKTGLVGLTRSLAIEWARQGIQVNALCPGWINADPTPVPTGGRGLEERRLKGGPPGRWGTPADLAGALVFLCSTASDFVTGQTLVADGGLQAGW